MHDVMACTTIGMTLRKLLCTWVLCTCQDMLSEDGISHLLTCGQQVCTVYFFGDDCQEVQDLLVRRTVARHCIDA